MSSEYPISGRGFFPVTSGSFHDGSPSAAIGRRKLIFVGQDWGCEGNLPPLGKDKDADIKTGTGKILLDLLDEAEIRLEECFFTNALWGIRTGNTNTGASPGWKDPAFVRSSAAALKVQIDVVRPRGLVCLGRDAPGLLKGLMAECDPWKTMRSFKAIDHAGLGVIDVNSFAGIDVAAILLHPSFRRVNLKHRCYGGLVEHEAELKILSDVWARVSV